MTISPFILRSQRLREGVAGNSNMTLMISSLDRKTESAPPMAIKLVEAKNAAPFCKAAVTWVDHAHVALEQAFHPFVAIAVHEGVEAVRPFADRSITIE